MHRLADRRLVAASAWGDIDAFAHLWARHDHQVRAASDLFWPSPAQARRAVHEVRTRLVRQLRGGWCPEGPFRVSAYRTVAQVAGVRGTSADESDSITVRTFDALSPGDQELLWYRDVEGARYRELGTLCGIGAPDVYWATDRARVRLRQLWLTAMTSPQGGSPCERGLASVLVGGARRVEPTHEAWCATCSTVHQEASRLETLVRPALLHGVLGPEGVRLAVSAPDTHRSPRRGRAVF